MVLFINDSYIKEVTQIDDSVESKKIYEHIELSQEIRIQDCLGTQLYEKMQDLVRDSEVNNVTIPEPYITLLEEYIAPCQAKWVQYYIIIDLNYNMTNKSISKKSSDYGTPVELEELTYIRKAKESIAQSYSKRMTDYLANNQAQFPELWQQTGINKKPAFSNRFFGGMYLGGGRNCCE